MKKRSHGFTLMELLVVMGIILLLAALLTPVVTSILERGRRTYCLNNVRMIATAAAKLFDDSDPELPYRGNTGNSGIDWGAATAQLLPYLDDNVNVFNCPSNDGTEDHWNCAVPADPEGNYGAFYTQYEMNGFLCSHDAIIRKSGGILYPAEAAYAYDFPYQGDDTPHKTGINIAFLDGHAEWVATEDLGLEGAETNRFYKSGHIF
ncbi:MAG: prepilin-type N-terminal cleavage/methylation domain-containing protein [Verrucomicrobia bacterium]|nr:prepilin-type N-terminal cleavage/methylation domain-containing protein [Verrucomicrobiota bacterium]